MDEAGAGAGAVPVPVPVPVPVHGKQTSPCIDCALRTQPHLCGALFGDKEQGTLNRRWSSLSQHHKVARSRRTIYRSNEPTNSIAIICQGWACCTCCCLTKSPDYKFSVAGRYRVGSRRVPRSFRFFS